MKTPSLRPIHYFSSFLTISFLLLSCSSKIPAKLDIKDAEKLSSKDSFLKQQEEEGGLVLNLIPSTTLDDLPRIQSVMQNTDDPLAKQSIYFSTMALLGNLSCQRGVSSACEGFVKESGLNGALLIENTNSIFDRLKEVYSSGFVLKVKSGDQYPLKPFYIQWPAKKSGLQVFYLNKNLLEQQSEILSTLDKMNDDTSLWLVDSSLEEVIAALCKEKSANLVVLGNESYCERSRTWNPYSDNILRIVYKVENGVLALLKSSENSLSSFAANPAMDSKMKLFRSKVNQEWKSKHVKIKNLQTIDLLNQWFQKSLQSMTRVDLVITQKNNWWKPLEVDTLSYEEVLSSLKGSEDFYGFDIGKRDLEKILCGAPDVFNSVDAEFSVSGGQIEGSGVDCKLKTAKSGQLKVVVGQSFLNKSKSLLSKEFSSRAFRFGLTSDQVVLRKIGELESL